jgi:hypothetical protein
VSAADDRARIRTIIGEASQSYGLSKSGKSLEMPLILIDEFESGFEDDPSNYLASLRYIVRTSKAPVVLICDDLLPRVLSTNGFNLDERTLQAAEVIRFTRPSEVECAQRLDHVLPSLSASGKGTELARVCEGDIRRALQQAHFYGPGLGRLLEKTVPENIECGADGLEDLLALYKPPQVFTIKPSPLPKATKGFTVDGRFLSQDCRVYVGEFNCAYVDFVSESTLKAHLVLPEGEENASHGENQEDEESELDDDFEPDPRAKRQNRSGFEIRSSVVIERHLRAVDLNNGRKHLDFVLRSDDDPAHRFNSLFTCVDESSMPVLVIPPPKADPQTLIKRQVDMEVARSNIRLLRRSTIAADAQSVAESVMTPRRGGLDPKDNSLEAEMFYSFGDSSGLELATSLGFDPVHGDKVESKRRHFLTQARRHYVRIDNQPTRALLEDIPFYVRMARLDLMRKKTHAGRRRYTSHFSHGMAWLEPEDVAELGLQDLDLGYN